MMHATKHLCSLLVVVGLLCLLASVSRADDPLPPQTDAAPLAITTIPSDGFNLTVEECIPPDRPERIVAGFLHPTHNFFAGTLTNLPTDRELTIGLSMAGNDTKGNKADVSKWRGLRPLLSYADPTRYESYEWFAKDAQGRWISGDIFNTGEAKFAGAGAVPEQQAVPAEVAAQFLSADGQYWSPWREIADTDTEVIPTLNVFRLKQKFDLPTAVVSMRVPYTYTYLQAFIGKLQAAKLPGVTVDDVGMTPQKRKLQVIRVEDPHPTPALTPAERKTILVIAREHANEHASSWALHGILTTLIADSPEAAQMRKDTTWLFIPIQDPDGSASGSFDRMTDRFRKPYAPETPPEVFAYAHYFTNYVYTERRTIDMVISLHNVEATECANLFNPFFDKRYQNETIAFNRSLGDTLHQRGYHVGAPDRPWATGFMSFRLYGWLSAHFGSFQLAFEVNDRYPAHRLSVAELQGIGTELAGTLASWRDGETGRHWHQRLIDESAIRQRLREAHFTKQGYGLEKRTRYDLLVRGY